MSFEFDFSAPPPARTTTREPTRDVYTPSRLNKEARTMLERGFSALWVEGEISNLSRPSSGHWYFSLKDDAAQLRCAMFRQKNMLIRFTPKDGMHVQIRGRVSLYEARGDYQFLADHIEEAGEGALRREFELLKTKLAVEGLFATERKRALPKLPRRIGVITSPTGAAVRDVLHILRRRFCSIPVLIYPVPVQGAASAPQIAAAIRFASARSEVDVLLLARGGGSLEDLWAFNEEVVARAMFDCRIPIVSGIGHEVDFTIADFVADVRAPTPSGAAELIAPDCNEWMRSVQQVSRQLSAAVQRQLKQRRERVTWLQRRLAQLHPGIELRQRAQRLDELEQRLIRGVRHTLLRQRSTLAHEIGRLRHASPRLRVANAHSRLQASETHLARLMRKRLEGLRARLADQLAALRHASPRLRLANASARLQARETHLSTLMRKRLVALNSRLNVAAGRLNTVSPLATLQRGYAIVTNAAGTVVTNAQSLQEGELIEARLAQGSVRARIEGGSNG
jgi:exodeoxyribonuclease VII large subunit